MQNDDLISRSALLAAYDAAHKGPPGGARKLIAEAPAIDAVPVVHGWWVDENPSDYMDVRMCCSACRRIDTPFANWDYCPHCGAKMDGGG